MADVRVNGVRLYVEERGRGEPIVCIHGTSSSAMVWRGDATDALAELGRVIVYDRRGCTRSERPEPYATSVVQHAEDAVDHGQAERQQGVDAAQRQGVHQLLDELRWAHAVTSSFIRSG